MDAENPSERFRRLASDIRVPQELKARVLDAATRSSSPGAHRDAGRWSMTRRGLVTAACCAVCASAFLIVGKRVGDDGEAGWYGLQVAQASEYPVPLAPTGQGMTPIGTANGLSLLFHLNLDVCGTDVSIVRYRVEESPFVDYDYAYEPFKRQAVAFRQVGKTPTGELSFSGPPLALVERSGRDVSDQEGPSYVIEVCLQPGDLWESDEVLSLFGTYVELVRMGVYGADALAEDELEQETRNLKYRLGDLLADKLREGSFLDWMRRVYATYLQLAGDMLAQSVLEVDIVRETGPEVARRYRIEPVADIAARASRHFDALLAQNGHAQGEADGRPVRLELDVDKIPFWNFVDGELSAEFAEAYGCEPLFSINEVG